MKANLQDTQQMKEFMAQFKEEYGRETNGHDTGVETHEECDSGD